MSGDLLRDIRTTYQASEACVRVGGEVTEWFEVRQGVRQRYPMLSWLFSIYLRRYGGQRSMRQFSGRSDIECMQGAGTVVCG